MPPRLNIPPITRGALILLLAQSTLSAALRYQSWTSSSDVLVVPWLSLVPALSVVYPWTLFTSTFVETNVFTLAASLLTLYHGGRYLERAWTSKEFAKFVLIIAMLSNVFTFAALYSLFLLTGNFVWSLTPVRGTTSLQIGFLVAFTQLIPTHTVTLFRGIISLRVPRFPLLYLLVVLVLAVSPIFSCAHVLLALNGFIISWTYLRFYKPAFPDLDTNQGASLRGDASETFAFAEFFPDVTRPAISGISNQIFNLLVTLGICTSFSQEDHQASGGGETAYVGRSAAGSSRAETERRRALALKALDQRLNAATAAAAARAPQPPVAGQGDVSTQPKVIQPAMTAPGNLLAETHYSPDGDKGSTQA